MTEQLKSDNSSMPQQTESDVLVLIKKIHQQLVFLEKKIDLLISQSPKKPFRSFGHPHRPGQYHDNRGRGQDSRERGFQSGHHFEKHRGDENRGFGGPPKNYSNDRENSPGQDRPFKKKYDGKNRGFDPRKKPFFHKRKDQ